MTPRALPPTASLFVHLAGLLGGLILWHLLANDAPVVLRAFVATGWLGTLVQRLLLRTPAP